MRGEYIAVDWGTTNRRAYAVDASGRVTESFADEKGLLAVPRDGFAAAAAEIRDKLGDRPMLLAGMVGSNRGWREAPYVPCPASLAGLAEAMLWVEPERTAIVPGVCQSGTAGADVMRGEEVQALGAHACGLLPSDALVCHPGTHAKWVLLAGGRLEAFRTMMTGEMFSLLSKHSILSEQLQGDVEADPAFLDGARQGLAGADLLATLFGIRARFLLGEPRGSAASFASGLLIGSDVRAGLALARGGPVALVGRADLCALYAAALAETGHQSLHVDGAQAFLAGIHALKELI